jgi:hypothetical protein
MTSMEGLIEVLPRFPYLKNRVDAFQKCPHLKGVDAPPKLPSMQKGGD